MMIHRSRLTDSEVASSEPPNGLELGRPAEAGSPPPILAHDGLLLSVDQ
jgi:hypothetical protein